MPDVFARVLSLYELGQCLDAWEAGRSQGPLEDWPAVKPRLLAARLADHLGAPGLSQRLGLAVFRAHSTDPRAQYYRVLRVFERRGALAAWSERKRLGQPSGDDPIDLADYHGQCAMILGTLRDFETAESHIAKARAAADRPYWYAERASLSTLEDRYEEALAFAREGLTAGPQYPPTIATAARTLQLLDRSDEALELLRSAAATTQSSHIIAFMVGILLKRRLLEETDRALERYDQLTPLKEDTARNLIAVTRAEIAVHRGDYRTAMELVEQVQHPFYATIAENLRTFLADASGAPPRRVELDVPFVRQHHMTCAPATLSAISQFWKRPAAHMEVAEEICYDGTPNHSERRWANENGWRTAEFRVDWDSAAGLIDRGAPFTLNLSDVASGHLVAVIGYDRPRDLLLARDPTVPETIEINARAMFAHQQATGPRGMALVPRDQATLLDGLNLPETALYDLYNDFELALERHDRDAALAVHRSMIAADPRHRLTLNARRALAAYDDNPHDALAAIDELLGLYPDDQYLQLMRLGCLRQLATRDDRLAWLAQVCERPGADPLLWIENAVELMSDNRMLGRALHLVRRGLNRRRDDPYGIQQLARLHWSLGKRAEALELFRFAACVGTTREHMVQEYFNACRWLNQTDTGLAFLRARVERLGAQSGQPAMTLFWALETLDRMDEAFTVLEAAVSRRPHDDDVRIWAANRYAAWGRAEPAAAHLAAAKGAKRTSLLAEEARAARLAGDRRRALDAWQEILALRPLNLEAHRAVALLVSEMSDAEAAAKHLQEYCERFPHNAGLRHLLYEWTASRSAAEREDVLRQLRAIDPANAWTTRELALNLCGQARFPEALQLAEESVALDDDSAPSHNVRAYVLQAAGRRAEAAESYRAAISRSADAGDAIRGLLETAGETRAQALEVLTFVESKLLEQSVIGDAVLAFGAAARGILTPAELFLPLERLHAQRPDLWQSWSALCNHNVETGRTDEALNLARQATERFSLVPRMWLDLSRVHRARQEPDEEIAALRRCREINPEWIEAVVELVKALARAGRPDESERTLESAIRLMPLVPELRGHLAVLRHQRGERDKAIEILRETLRVSPDYWWAWGALIEWSKAQGRATEAIDLAVAFAESRPGESNPWVRLADLRLRVERFEEALAAAERAIGISPLDVAAHDLKASALAELRRFREAEEACRPAAFGAEIPLVLQGRGAWVDARRGDFSRAIERMDALVEAHPDYAWGWSQLVDWNWRLNANLPAIAAAERLAWLEHRSPRAWGWIGDLRLRQRDRKGAAEAFQRAMRLQPSDVYAGFQLFQLLRHDTDYGGARRTLEILRQFAAREEIRAAEAELAASEGDRQTYLVALRELCSDPTTGDAAPARAVDAIVRGDWRRHAERTLKQVIAGAGWNPVTPILWVRVRARRGRLGGPLTYRWLAGLGEPGKRAVEELLGHVGAAAKGAGNDWVTNGRLTMQLLLIRHFWKAWQGDDAYWGQFGYALTALGQSRWAVRWLRSWGERSKIEPWMVQNLISALLSLHRGVAARAELRRVALEMAPRREIGVILGLWGTIGACLDDDLRLAERLLHETPRDVVSDAYRPLWELATTLLDICRDPPVRASLSAERTLRLERTTAELQRLRDTGYLARLAALKAARHAGARWKMVTAWMSLHKPTVVALSIIVFYLSLRLL